MELDEEGNPMETPEEMQGEPETDPELEVVGEQELHTLSSQSVKGFTTEQALIMKGKIGDKGLVENELGRMVHRDYSLNIGEWRGRKLGSCVDVVTLKSGITITPRVRRRLIEDTGGEQCICFIGYESQSQELSNTFSHHKPVMLEVQRNLMDQKRLIKAAKEFEYDDLYGEYDDWRGQKPNHGGGDKTEVENGFQGTTLGFDINKGVSLQLGCGASSQVSDKDLRNCLNYSKEWAPYHELYVWDPGQVKIFMETRKFSKAKENAQGVKLPLHQILKLGLHTVQKELQIMMQRLFISTVVFYHLVDKVSFSGESNGIGRGLDSDTDMRHNIDDKGDEIVMNRIAGIRVVLFLEELCLVCSIVHELLTLLKLPILLWLEGSLKWNSYSKGHYGSSWEFLKRKEAIALKVANGIKFTIEHRKNHVASVFEEFHPLRPPELYCPFISCSQIRKKLLQGKETEDATKVTESVNAISSEGKGFKSYFQEFEMFLKTERQMAGAESKKLRPIRPSFNSFHLEDKVDLNGAVLLRSVLGLRVLGLIFY